MVTHDPAPVPMPPSAVVHSRSAQVLRDRVARVTPHEVTPVGSTLRGTAGVVDLVTSQLAFVRYGGDVIVEAPPTHDRVVATVPLGPMRVSAGLRDEGTVHDSAFLLSATSRTLMKPDPWMGALVVAADADRLHEHANIVFGGEVPRPVSGRAAGLLDVACRRAWTASAAIDEISSEAVLKDFVLAIEDHLMTAMVLAWQVPSGVVVRVATSRVDELRQWLELNHGPDVTTSRMAQQFGTSVRQLQEAIRIHLGMTPTQLLREVRLVGARRRLLDSDPAHVTVAAVAHSEGFAHVGRFSTAYRNRFDEYPAVTLRRGATP